MCAQHGRRAGAGWGMCHFNDQVFDFESGKKEAFIQVHRQPITCMILGEQHAVTGALPSRACSRQRVV